MNYSVEVKPSAESAGRSREPAHAWFGLRHSECDNSRLARTLK